MNIFDYLKWRGDLTFNQDPFNEVDNLVLSYIAYVDFDNIITKNISLKEASNIFFSKHKETELKKNKSFVAQAPFVLKEASKTNRFKNIIFHDYINIINKEKTEQFSAMQMDLADSTTFIAYRGTDDTLVGWKEDLEIAYKEIPAHTKALEYLIHHQKPFKTYRVGGHSKGGSLALFATLNAPKNIKSKIISIYNNDGPWINEYLFDEKKFEDIKDKYICIYPEFSVFGQIFIHDSKTIVSKSNQILLLQHDPTSWLVEGKHFVNTSQSIESKAVKEALDDFFNSTTLIQREKLVNSLNASINEMGLNTVLDMYNNGLAPFIKAFKKYLNSDPESKEIGNKLIKAFEASANKTVKNAIDNIQKDANELIKEKINKIKK